MSKIRQRGLSGQRLKAEATTLPKSTPYKACSGQTVHLEKKTDYTLVFLKSSRKYCYNLPAKTLDLNQLHRLYDELKTASASLSRSPVLCLSLDDTTFAHTSPIN